MGKTIFSSLLILVLLPFSAFSLTWEEEIVAKSGSVSELRKLAEKLWNLGGVENRVKAIELDEKAVSKSEGFATRESMCALGYEYSNIEGSKRDISLAKKWYVKAFQYGMRDAAYNLALVYWREENDAYETIKWLIKAAQCGYGEEAAIAASKALSKCYLEGTFVNDDRDLASLWYQLQKAQGSETRDTKRIAVLWLLASGDFRAKLKECDIDFYEIDKMYLGDGAVKIDETINEIASGTFKNCLALKSVEIGEEVEVVMPYAFANCKNLKSVEIGEEVEAVMPHAFANCKDLKKVVIHKGPYCEPKIHEYAFEGTPYRSYQMWINIGVLTLKILGVIALVGLALVTLRYLIKYMKLVLMKKSKATVFLGIFAWSIVIIGSISCFFMLGMTASRSGETILWDQGMVAEATLTFVGNIIATSLVLLIAKSDSASVDIECLRRSVVIRVVQTLFAFGAVILVGAFIWAVMASDRDFARAMVHGMLSKGSLSDFLTLGRIVDGGADLRILVTIMIGVGIWYMVGFCFVWGALGRILGRVVGASEMKKSYEQKLQALKNPEPKSDEVRS